MPLESADEIKSLLERTNRIAMVGASPKANRASNGVLKFLLDQGYEVIPVNPGHAGSAIHGADVVASLADIDQMRYRKVVMKFVGFCLPVAAAGYTRILRQPVNKLGVPVGVEADHADFAGCSFGNGLGDGVGTAR